MSAQLHELASVFEEWERWYREQPREFLSEAERFLGYTPETYGQAAAATFVLVARRIGLDHLVENADPEPQPEEPAPPGVGGHLDDGE